MIPLLDAGLRIIDKIIPDPAERERARLELLRLQQDGELEVIRAQSRVIEAEASSEHALTAMWRPIVMLWFAGLIGAHWFGLTPEALPGEQVEELLAILKIAIGGYVIGRSGEKIAEGMRK